KIACRPRNWPAVPVVKTRMRSLRATIPATLPACLFWAALAIAGAGIVQPTVAQERRSERGEDRGDSGERRRGAWGPSRRDRNERRENRDDDRKGSASPEAKASPA